MKLCRLNILLYSSPHEDGYYYRAVPRGRLGRVCTYPLFDGLSCPRTQRRVQAYVWIKTIFKFLPIRYYENKANIGVPTHPY